MLERGTWIRARDNECAHFYDRVPIIGRDTFIVADYTNLPIIGLDIQFLPDFRFTFITRTRIYRGQLPIFLFPFFFSPIPRNRRNDIVT